MGTVHTLEVPFRNELDQAFRQDYYIIRDIVEYLAGKSLFVKPDFNKGSLVIHTPLPTVLDRTRDTRVCITEKLTGNANYHLREALNSVYLSYAPDLLKVFNKFDKEVMDSFMVHAFNRELQDLEKLKASEGDPLQQRVRIELSKHWGAV